MKSDARWHWLAAAGLLLEFLVLDQVLSRHHAWIYPRWNDQIQYLTEAYTGYEYLKGHGWFAGLWQTLVNPSAQGTLHDFYAVLIFTVAGPSRSAALSVNVLFFLAWQVALYFAVLRGTRSRALALAAAGLLLSVHTLGSGAVGSFVDFRLDWGTCCAFGLTLALAMCTEGFRSLRWSLAFGVSVGLVLVTRFLTGAYLAPIFAVLLIWCLTGPERGRRAGHLLLAALIAGALAAPFFWLNRDWVYNYYFIGHFTGPESAIRSLGMGVGRSLQWVLQTWWSWHVGAGCAWLVLGGTVGFGVLAIRRGRTAPASNPAGGPEGGKAGWWVLGATFFLVPVVVLTLHSQKSEPVLSILLPGAVLLVLALWRTLARRCSEAAMAVALGWSIVAFGGGIALGQLAWPKRDPGYEASARRVNELADYIYRTSRAAQMTSPYIGVDQVTDMFDAQIMRVICYERHRAWVTFLMTLPTGIMEEKPEVLRERLVQSDFMFLTDQLPGDGHWPYDQQMHRLYPEFKAWCEEHLKPVASFTVFDRRMTLYQRRDIGPAVP